MSGLLGRLQVALAERYSIERELGHGGMATVYLAEDLKHRRLVALKVLSPDLAASLGTDRFLREIDIAARLTHPHILPLHDSGEADGLLYYVMHYVEGESLRGRLNRERQLPLEDALHITAEVADALDYGDSHDVLHRDSKPENILFQSGHAVVSDFGIARALGVAGVSRVTGTGIAVGTPGYMSPEQAGGVEQPDGRSDLYSLGCVLYEMLAGDPPFTGWSAGAILARQAAGPVPRLRTVRDTVPDWVEQAVTRALAKAPADRFATAADFIAALIQPRTVTGAEPAAALVQPPAAANSIAVLPFLNMSADPENEYFSDGMTEEIVHALSAVGSLRVASRTSSFAFKGATQNIRTIGEKLQVRTVLEGSVRRADTKLRVTAQLINAADGFHLWSATYEREMKDVFAIQDEIARAIVTALKLKLTDEPSLALVEPRTASVEAYALYLKARYFWRRKSASGLKKGIEYFQQAIAVDPGYSLAYAGLADSHIARGYYVYLPPNYLFTYTVLGQAYLAASRYDEAIGALQSAVRFSGGLSFTTATLGYAYAKAGKRREARKVLQSLKERSGNEYVPPFCVALVYAGLGDRDQAFACLDRAYEERSYWLAYLKTWPLVDDLRADARFTALLDRVGLR